MADMGSTADRAVWGGSRMSVSTARDNSGRSVANSSSQLGWYRPLGRYAIAWQQRRRQVNFPHSCP